MSRQYSVMTKAELLTVIHNKNSALKMLEENLEKMKSDNIQNLMNWNQTYKIECDKRDELAVKVEQMKADHAAEVYRLKETNTAHKRAELKALSDLQDKADTLKTAENDLDRQDRRVEELSNSLNIVMKENETLKKQRNETSDLFNGLLYLIGNQKR